MKRLSGLLLAVVILFSALAMGAKTVSAESGLQASPECIAALKAEEGFSRVPYWDYAQYTVGYGTRCPDDKLDYYTANGITEAEAEELLYIYVNAFANALNTLLVDKYQLNLSQNQFDALLMFTYNCGTGWLYKEQDNLRDAIVNGVTGNELIDRFARWCNAGGQILKPLLRRRLCEANMYLNGVYSQQAPENFAYVLYDATGGTSSPNVQGYDTNLTAEIIPTPTYAGYQFEGWFTARIGGTQVTVLDASTRNARLYAHWKDAAGNNPAEDTSAQGTQVTILVNELNVRLGPGTNYSAAGQLNTGDKVTITETAANGSYTWGKFYGGWIRLDYTDYQAPAVDGATPPASTAVTGTVNVNDSLRIRSGPSTGYDVVGYLKKGERVEILEQKIVGHMTWGKISNGWISLDYVILDTASAPQPPATEPPATQPPATQPPAAQPPATEPPAAQPSGITGIVRVNEFLRIRSNAGTAYSIAGYLSPNETVTILEQRPVGPTMWGRIDRGWISLDYVVLNTAGSTGGSGQSVMGTVQVNDYLRIRSGPSTGYAIAGYLSPNERIEILEQKVVGGMAWGRISKGWVSLDYVRLDGAASGSSGAAQATKTITADCLRIRSSAGTNNTIVGYLYYGAKVQILETTMVGATQWGRISKGWISMDYAK